MNSALVDLDKGSAEYVILHAILKNRRGKKPSRPFGVERNPRKALALACYYWKVEEDRKMQELVLAVEMQNDRTIWKKRHMHSLGRENPHCVDCGKPVSEWLEDEECVPHEFQCKHGHSNKVYCGYCATEKEPKCKHGNKGYCVFCATEKLPRCEHDNHGYCAYCEEILRRNE